MFRFLYFEQNHAIWKKENKLTFLPAAKCSTRSQKRGARDSKHVQICDISCVIYNGQRLDPSNFIAMRDSRLVRKPGVVRLWLKAVESYEISLLGVNVSYVLSSSTCSISKCARDVIDWIVKKTYPSLLLLSFFLSFFLHA